MFNLLLAALPSLNPVPETIIPETIPPETIIITAQRAPLPIQQVAVSVSSLERLDLERLGYLTLADALRTLPGISADNSGGLGKQTSVRVRGEAGFRTRVYLDGMELSDVSAPQSEVPWSHLLLDGSLDYVEVLRGPQGLAWGADAGGVVLLQSSAQGAGVTGEWGRYDTGRASARVAGTRGQWRGAINVARLSTDGINALVADQTGELDPYSNTTWHATGGWQPSDRQSISAVWRRERAENAFDSSFGPEPDWNDRWQRDGGRLAWQYQGDVRTGVAVSSLESERRTFGSFDYGYESKVKALEVNAATENWQLGLDLRDEAGGGLDTALPERLASGAYAQGIWDVGRGYINGAVRFDHIESAGERATWRLGATLPQAWGSGWVKWRASAGTGFRAPSLYEAFTNQHNWQGTDPAPELAPERSAGAEVGFDGARSNGLGFGATLFYQQVERAIVYDYDNSAGYLQSAGTSRGHGLELAANHRLTRTLSAEGNYTYMLNETESGERERRRPRHSLNLSLLWRPMAAAEVALHGRAMADLADDVGGEPLPDYQLLDVTGRWALTTAFTLTGRVTNALGENYADVAGYATYGRAGYIGFVYQL